ncbi:cyclopropane-fatty-acyl-phospholipid synthase [Halobacteriovorax sp. GB3]|uniref:class I SAM-dependent methyltransferase n=1 Tax=Halobacteriovorax sp. GB3 TaxID=2719615 RepID=UPI002361B596|nr:cyclopropane-fatty-acyl-phospholipid synthase family protein [Halobacteriovorax sp. GB3]MDD0851499.1 cyclopropane-fatty-acyl-phospholipid synthase [Halobacteriovorax sp. GB3]
MEKLNQNKLEMIKHKSSFSKKIVISLLERLDKGQLRLTFSNGTTLFIGDGDGVHCDITIHNDSFFKKCFLSGDIGFGESYVDGDWSTSDLTKVVEWLILNIEKLGLASGSKVSAGMMNLLQATNKITHFLNRNSKKGSQENISYHYDLSNSFYELMLDETMTYSCGIFEGASSLKDSQLLKYEKLCQDLDLKDGDHVLEIGCGWGGFASYAAKRNNITLHGVTISNEQLKYAQERMVREGLESRVKLEFCDYRDLKGKYDKIVSIEMLEAVGDEFLPAFFEKCDDLLAPDGLLSIQVITSPDSRYDSFVKGVDWIQKHIFPGSLLPSIGAMNKAFSKTNFHMYSLRDIGLDYGKTLKLWRGDFLKNWTQIKDLGFDETFKRKWIYYLCYCEAAFNTRNISDVQMTLIKPNNSKVFKGSVN